VWFIPVLLTKCYIKTLSTATHIQVFKVTGFGFVTFFFFTLSVQLLFTILLQRQVSAVSSYFWSTSRSVQAPVPYISTLPIYHFTNFFLKLKSSSLVRRASYLLNAPFVIAILDLISRVRLVSFVIMLPQYLIYSAFSIFFNLSIYLSGFSLEGIYT